MLYSTIREMNLLHFLIFSGLSLFVLGSLASSGRIACVSKATKAYAKLTPLQLTGKRVGKSLQVQDVDGQVSLIPRKFLKLGQKCLVVRVQKSRLREGPGGSFKALDTSTKGDAYLDLGGEDGWTQVQNIKGERSWINLDHTWSPVSNKMRMSFDEQP